MTSSPAKDTLALSSIGVQSLVEWPPLSFLFLAHKRWPLVTVTKPSVILIPRGSIGVVCIGVAQIDHTIGSGKLKKEKMATSRKLLCLRQYHNWRGLKAGMKALPGARLYLPSSEKKSISNSVVILVAWTGGSHRALKKYSEIYTAELGIPSLCLVPSLLEVWSTSKGNKLTQNTIDYLSKSNDSSEPINIVFHLFSAAPGIVLPHITDKPPDTSHIQLKGFIIDSGPVEFSYKSGMSALKLSNFNFLMYYVAGFCGTTANVLVGKRKRAELVKALKSPSLSSLPQLYLYSEADTVCPADRVRSIIEEQKELGRNVKGASWNDSKHVRHFMAYPEQYHLQIKSFLKAIKLID